MQLDLFDVMYERFMFEKDKPIRVVELFSGIGFQTMGMKLAEIPHEVVATCEVDKFAVLSYASIHTDYLRVRETYFSTHTHTQLEMVETLQKKNVGWNFATQRHTITHSTNIETLRDYFLADKLINNLGDISLLKASDFPKDIDIMTYSFPCTDLSKAGQRKGLSDGTRSGLVYEVVRLLKGLKEIDNLPQVPIMENVVDLIQRNYIDSWNEIQFDIEKLGYTNYTFTMNGRNYGIAQNRDRVFMVSILGDYNFVVPKEFELKYKLKDYLEKHVDESYYLSDSNKIYIFGNALRPELKDQMNRKEMFLNKEIAYTLNTKQDRRVGDTNYLTENKEQIKVKDYLEIPENTSKGHSEAYDENGNIKQRLETNGSESTNTLTTVQKDNVVVVEDKRILENNLRIRKLTPKETLRLMGGLDRWFERQSQVTSNAQMYKQHGNGIIAQVIGLIIGSMYYEDYEVLKETMFKNSFDWIK